MAEKQRTGCPIALFTFWWSFFFSSREDREGGVMVSSGWGQKRKTPRTFVMGVKGGWKGSLKWLITTPAHYTADCREWALCLVRLVETGDPLLSCRDFAPPAGRHTYQAGPEAKNSCNKPLLVCVGVSIFSFVVAFFCLSAFTIAPMGKSCLLRKSPLTVGGVTSFQRYEYLRIIQRKAKGHDGREWVMVTTASVHTQQQKKKHHRKNYTS